MAAGLTSAECDPDQFRTPGGVLAPQRHGRLTGPGRIGLGQPPGGAVVGPQPRLAALAEPLQQVADGADRQAEVDGELTRGLSLLRQLK
jgi:hypothetical protein